MSRRRRNPSTLAAVLIASGTAFVGGLLGYGLCRVLMIRKTVKRALESGTAPGASVDADCNVVVTQPELFLAWAIALDLQTSGESLAVALMDNAFPQCSWPPTDPTWSITFGDAGRMTWSEFVGAVEGDVLPDWWGRWAR